MEVNIQFINMPNSKSMETYTFDKLERLAKKYTAIIHIDVFWFNSQK
tara:strand:- start:22 stop:162 length:141 start_codon:yes stop_codon:yes gene_type:complete